MNEAILVAGAIILVLSIFGFTYAEDQQGLSEGVEGVLQGENTDWNIVSSVSLAGIALGAVLVIAGLVPNEWYSETQKNNNRI
ncbi:MAG: hypothetical protein R6V35_00975 [Candidatus Nanohaloarchaea archaeon]